MEAVGNSTAGCETKSLARNNFLINHELPKSLVPKETKTGSSSAQRFRTNPGNFPRQRYFVKDKILCDENYEDVQSFLSLLGVKTTLKTHYPNSSLRQKTKCANPYP